MLGITLDTDQYFDRLQTELTRLDRAAVTRWAERIFRCWTEQRFVWHTTIH